MMVDISTPMTEFRGLPPRFAVRYVILPDAATAAEDTRAWCDIVKYLPGEAFERCMARDRVNTERVNAMIEYVARPEVSPAVAAVMPRLENSEKMREYHSNLIGLCMRQGLAPAPSLESDLSQCHWTPEMMLEMRKYRRAVRRSAYLWK